MAGQGNSIGDFFIDIIPRVDTASIKEGVAFLGNLGNATKLFDKGRDAIKSFFGVFSDTAEYTTQMLRFAESIDQPIEKVQTLRRMFEFAGASVDSADESMKALVSNITKLRFGEMDFKKLGMAGMGPGAFSGDPMKDINTMREVFNKMNASQRMFFVSGTGLSEDALKILRLSNKEWKEIYDRSQSAKLLSDKQLDNNKEYINDVKELRQQYDAFKASLLSEITPALTDDLDALKNILKDREFIKAVEGLTIALSKVILGISKILEWTLGGSYRLGEKYGNLVDRGGLIGVGKEKLKNFLGEQFDIPSWQKDYSVMLGANSSLENRPKSQKDYSVMLGDNLPSYAGASPESVGKGTIILHQNNTINGATDPELLAKYKKATKEILAEMEMEHNLNITLGGQRNDEQ